MIPIKSAHEVAKTIEEMGVAPEEAEKIKAHLYDLADEIFDNYIATKKIKMLDKNSAAGYNEKPH